MHAALVLVTCIVFGGSALAVGAAPFELEVKLDHGAIVRGRVLDEAGKPVSYELYQAGSRAAAGFSPEASGLYYVKVSSEDSQPATFCLIYTYK